MASIANLGVSITARIGNFTKGFNKVKKSIRRFSRDLKRHTGTMARYGAAILTVATTAIAYLVKGQFAAVDSLSKLSRTTGLTTEQMSGYQHAIQIAGGSQEGFSKAVIRMNRGIADAQAGLSTAIREFDRAGVSLDELANLSTDERIKLLADRYLSIGDAAGRASFLMNLFGRQGIAVGNLFEQGSEGIEKAQKEAERLGLTISAFDAQKVEMANDAITRMKNLIIGAARSLAVKLAPFVIVAADKLREMGENGNTMGKIVLNSFDNILSGIAKMLDFVELLKSGWFSFQGVVQSSVAIILSPINAIGDGIANLLNMVPGVNVEFRSITEAFEKDFSDAAEKSFSKASKAFDKYMNKENSTNAKVFFKEVEEMAEKASLDIGKTLGFGDQLNDVEESKRATFARKIDLSRTSLGGVTATEKSTTKKQGDMMINKLAQIAKNTNNSTAVVS